MDTWRHCSWEGHPGRPAVFGVTVHCVDLSPVGAASVRCRLFQSPSSMERHGVIAPVASSWWRRTPDTSKQSARHRAESDAYLGRALSVTEWPRSSQGCAGAPVSRPTPKNRRMAVTRVFSPCLPHRRIIAIIFAYRRSSGNHRLDPSGRARRGHDRLFGHRRDRARIWATIVSISLGRSTSSWHRYLDHRRSRLHRDDRRLQLERDHPRHLRSDRPLPVLQGAPDTDDFAIVAMKQKRNRSLAPKGRKIPALRAARLTKAARPTGVIRGPRDCVERHGLMTRYLYAAGAYPAVVRSAAESFKLAKMAKLTDDH